MSEVKIKNITVIVDGQEYTFSGRSTITETVYTPDADPEVQGKGLADVQVDQTPIVPVVEVEPVVVPAVEPVLPDTPVVAPDANTTA